MGIASIGRGMQGMEWVEIESTSRTEVILIFLCSRYNVATHQVRRLVNQGLRQLPWNRWLHGNAFTLVCLLSGSSTPSRQIPHFHPGPSSSTFSPASSAFTIRSTLFNKPLLTEGSDRSNSAAFSGSGRGSVEIGKGIQKENIGGGAPSVTHGGGGRGPLRCVEAGS